MPISTLVRMVDPKVLERLFSKHQKMLSRLSVCRAILLVGNYLSVPAMYHGFDWYGRTLEVREVGIPSD